MKVKAFFLCGAFLAGCVTATIYFGGSGVQDKNGSGKIDGRSFRGPVAMAVPEWMTQDEKNTVSVFDETAKSVVFVVNKAIAYDFFLGSREEVKRGAGSGFIWDKQGHIVTNYHVVEGGDSFTVILSDQHSYDAKVVGIASSKELAVLKIDAPSEDLVPLKMGRSDNLKVGQKVLAIGNPFGLDRSLTTGVVSALGRKIKSLTGRTIHDVIQTDAAINPGNSGGPLLNSRGELIGINTAIFSPSGANAGIGFAVPVNTVKRSIPMLLKYGKLKRPSLGSSVFTDSWVRRYLGKEGVLLKDVPSSSAASKAGLRGTKVDLYNRIILGDLIVSIDGNPVSNLDELLNVLEKHKAGDQLKLTYIREGKKKTTTVTLEDVLE